jgi:Dynamin family
MSTVLTRLSHQLDEQLLPLIELIDETTEGLAALRGVTADAETIAPRLAALRESLRTLRDKVAAQQSYVLLFGPLKSGKSTLMNALAAAYVSEVTSLPAYPCMVYVRHAPDLEVSLARWDGSVERFPGLVSMRAHVAAGHADLAHALRAAEIAREEFDPALHLPRAIRRVDVEMPAPTLQQSGTALVDTPGLYTRMKFGYDQLTREFRLASAVAVFVVKTDNLFLEQVFQEFDDLLRLFSRIFLVVNLDTAKQDLEPGGGLEPSLERRDPARILAAFEELAMGATLRRARDEGRLQIYPIDLLQAASARLRAGAARPAASPPVVSPPAGSPPADAGIAAPEVDESAVAPPEIPADFARFLADLTDYLNSHEALLAFVRDSLRQGRGVFAELARVCRGPGAAAASRMVAMAEAESAHAAERSGAARRLRSRSFDDGLTRFRDDVASITRERSVEVRKRASDRVEAALDRWFEADRSYAQLVGEDLVGEFAECRDALAELAREAAGTVLGSDVAATSVRHATPEEFRVLDLPLAEIAREALAGLAAVESGKSAMVAVPSTLVPVKRSLLDWLLLRGPVRVRRALFGPEESPTRPVSRAVKQKRLGPAARAALGTAVRVRLDRFFAESLAQSAVAAFGAGASAVGARLHIALERAGAEAATALGEARASLARRAAIRAGIEMVAGSAERAAAAMDRIAVEHGVAEPGVVEPAPPPGQPASVAGPEPGAEADADDRGEEDWADRS